MAPPVLLIFGAGANVGLAVMKIFRADGYKIAAVARSSKPDIVAAADKFIAADLSAEPSQIAEIFKDVQETLGRPNVVVYNGTYLLHLSSPSYTQIYSKGLCTKIEGS
jgi:NAD(P)-dependent dehydrogenase (short-subunit alcohol dehydrogenase family)